jgi:probable F420-dependent oxidoreductase
VRPFRFGVLVERFGDGDDVRGTAARAEALGYATLLIRDHLVAEPFGHQLAPLTTLAAVAAATRRLRVGTLVLAVDYRHPAVLAKEVATLDRLSGGRVELGLGAGWARDEYARVGIPFDRDGLRVDRFAEALGVLKGLFADEPFTFAGEHYRFEGYDAFPKPVQRPHPPILVGAGGRRMLSIAAREADTIGLLAAPIAGGVIAYDDDPSTRAPERMARQVDWIREAAGERFERIELSTMVSPVVAGDRGAAAEALAAARGWSGLPPEAVLAMPSILIGTVDAMEDDLRARRERLGLSYLVVRDRDMSAMAPVVERLGGR